MGFQILSMSEFLGPSECVRHFRRDTCLLASLKRHTFFFPWQTKERFRQKDTKGAKVSPTESFSLVDCMSPPLHSCLASRMVQRCLPTPNSNLCFFSENDSVWVTKSGRFCCLLKYLEPCHPCRTTPSALGRPRSGSLRPASSTRRRPRSSSAKHENATAWRCWQPFQIHVTCKL